SSGPAECHPSGPPGAGPGRGRSGGRSDPPRRTRRDATPRRPTGAVTPSEERVLRAVEALADEMVAFTQDLVRIPTVNPPGDCYRDCVALIESRLSALGYATETFAAEGLP